ncbi:tetratricopeptide repeat protein [Cupriavidus campinensis]|uniref:Tetratricopeptide repeat protein n=1 Tax=Cupriavidus campinensis TaxID=151783 RepID=A0AAE9L4C9_9BURK|nr:tetratricopeptide repeat protein [Cupriavidus campinensis]URF06823.1 tetratricopeptide repeat protein [Cupriavidus campinensis]
MEVNVEIEALKKTIKDGTQLTEYARTVPYYAIAELVPYVSPDNVEALNRLASCLIRNGRASEATPLLQNIVAKFQAIPGAKLNLADAYWETGHQAISSRIYLEYYERAISQGIHDIPARVLERKEN